MTGEDEGAQPPTTYGQFMRLLKSRAPCAHQDKIGRWRVCGRCPDCEHIIAAERRNPVNWNVRRDETVHEVPLEAGDRAVHQRFASEVWT